MLVRLFTRRDAFRRFYTCLLYVPRDRYNTQVRQRIEQMVWIFFMKIFDDREAEIELLDPDYKSPIPAEMRWRAWAAPGYRRPTATGRTR